VRKCKKKTVGNRGKIRRPEIKKRGKNDPNRDDWGNETGLVKGETDAARGYCQKERKDRGKKTLGKREGQSKCRHQGLRKGVLPVSTLHQRKNRHGRGGKKRRRHSRVKGGKRPAVRKKESKKEIGKVGIWKGKPKKELKGTKTHEKGGWRVKEANLVKTMSERNSAVDPWGLKRRT